MSTCFMTSSLPGEKKDAERKAQQTFSAKPGILEKLEVPFSEGMFLVFCPLMTST